MQSVVEQIKDRLPITDVLSSYITLIPAGRQYKAKCPFHNERTASFSVSPERGLYYCFGCAAKGDIFTFVQQFEGMDFNGALKILAERAGVSLSERDHKKGTFDGIYEMLEKTTQRYQNELQKNNEALLYLQGRGITAETIAQFRLGYAPDEWRFIAHTCTSEEQKQYALRAGLIKNPEQDGEGKSPYDRFRGRIMFPLSDASGRVVGFSGRLFPEHSGSKKDNTASQSPKYLNSPETEVFQKSRILYGFDKAKFHIKRHNFAILVEGQMDLLLSHQAGFRNTVATSGTAVSEQLIEDAHANLVVISRLTPNLFLAFDGDAAGEKALGRAALVALTLNMNPKVVPVPHGVDPADFIVANGVEPWKTLLAESTHFIMHKTTAVRAFALSPHVLVRALREQVFPFLSKISSPIEQNLYIEMIAKELGIDAVQVGRELASFVAHQVSASYQKPLTQEQNAVPETLSARERFAAFVLRFPDADIALLKEKIIAISFGEKTFGDIVLDEDQYQTLLAIIERDYGMIADADRILVAKELYEKAVQEFFSELHREFALALRDAERADDHEKMQHLLSQLAELNKLRQGSS